MMDAFLRTIKPLKKLGVSLPNLVLQEASHSCVFSVLPSYTLFHVSCKLPKKDMQTSKTLTP